MRLTIRTNLAMRVLMACAVNDSRMVRRAEIAQAANASENHLAQVVHLLATSGYIETTRGRAGGLVLARPAGEISIGEVFRQFEAGVPFAECFSGVDNTCPLKVACRLRGALQAALDAFYGVLDGMTLQDLIEDNDGLEALLHLPGAAGASLRSGCVRIFPG
ncbi:RrF2 family transcriptional regulator [Celeribacter indicus]|uniref:BadM/Rrf2 family transcriptional regulator n=1 Tax=Celeribacter indicus TaxID=1208324 RepID=A0A0B5DVC7_9RHOB|nr:Rrf2 family transcriptional regulator [Celeribacter indicus]AJE46974.1 BadM/Rrf2 family transcriptional regulator [Celeribacter indicus]SDW77196.1 transcriptional regulator, BadM/Rrf2 family [Celeribacter indicus]